MTPDVDALVDKAIESHDNPTPKDVPKEGDVEVKEETDVKPEDATVDQGGEEKPEAKDESAGDAGDNTEKKDEGFTADEAEDVDEEESVEEDVHESAPSNLNPKQQWVFDNLPVIVAKGRTTPNGQIKEIQVKIGQQLPETFEFASKRDEIIFTQDLADQTLRANQLGATFDQQQQQESYNKFSQQENDMIREDITTLQTAGELPKFKYKSDDPKFNDDPATKEIQEVLNFYNEKNDGYVKQGKLARLSFEDAYYLHKAQSGSKKTEEQVQEDKERKEVSRKVGGGGGFKAEETPKPKIKSGTTIDQILSMHDALGDLN